MFTIFRLFTSIRLYLGCIVAIILVMILSRMDVISYRWTAPSIVNTQIQLGNNTFRPTTHTKQTAIMLTQSNISLGIKWSSSISSPILSANGDDISQALALTTNLKTIRQTDIIALIATSTDKPLTLRTYLGQTETTVRQWSFVMTRLQNRISNAQSIISNCTTQKTQASSLYNQWLNTSNAWLINTATEQGKIANACIAEQQTVITTIQWLIDRLSDQMTKTTEYTSIISQYQTVILSHGDLLNTTTPETLISLQSALKNIE